MRSDHQQATGVLGYDRTKSKFWTERSRTTSFATRPDGRTVPFELDASTGRDRSKREGISGRATCTVCWRVDALQFYGICELELRRYAGVLWGLNPFISLGLDFMMLSEESKESQDATNWWNLRTEVP